MNFLASLSSAVINAGSAALAAAGNGVPGLPAYTLGERVVGYQGKSIWTMYEGVKKDDSTPVSVFGFDAANPALASYSTGPDRRNLIPLAKNGFRKLRALRHPNILKFLDGAETDSTVWIVTERVRPLVVDLESRRGVAEESKVYGLLHLATALSFLNKDGSSIHGNLRPEALFVTQGGEWKLGGMEVCTRLDEDAGTLWNYAGMMPDSRSWASPEVRKGGYSSLREYDASALDAYHLHLLLYVLFNGPLPASFASSADQAPALPAQRGQIPAPLFQVWRRLGNPQAKARLKTSVFLELGIGSESTGGGWWPSNRLVKLSSALEGFALASESERGTLIRELRGVEKQALPDEFLKYKVLPSLVRAFEFGGGGPQMLPLILSLASSLDEGEYSAAVLQPLIRMFATPDRATRMALLEGLDKFADKLTQRDVCDKIWPHLMTGFGDVVPVVREATVKSILLIAPKLNDRILNNDLLRLLAKTQTDPEPGIRTNTCILLGRLSSHLQPATNRKVLVPAFARALRDPFVHARIAGLMALMATADVYEKEDLAGKVIPAMSICLIDRERAVREQGYKAMDMFIKKCEALTKDMPDIAPPEQGTAPAVAAEAASVNQPGLATNAAGAAGALAGWAFSSVAKKISPADLHAPIEARSAAASPAPSINGTNGPQRPSTLEPASLIRTASAGTTSSAAASPSIPGGFGGGDNEDWGGDLMNVDADEGDWDEFTSGQQPAQLKVDPFAARLSSAKPKSSSLGGARKGGALKLGAPTKSSALRVPMDMDAGDNWDIDESSTPTPKPAGLPKQKLTVKPASIAAQSPIKPLVKSTPPPAAAPKPAPPPAVPRHVTPPAPAPSPPLSSRPPPPAANPWAAAPAVTSPTLSAAPPSSRPATPAAVPLQSPPAEQPWGAASTVSVASDGLGVKTPAVSAPGSPVQGGPGAAGSSVPLTAEEKAAKLAAAREERRLRMEKMRAKK